MASADPKHGRWILPLIITAMVVLTFTFVNNIEPAGQVDSTTTTRVPPLPDDAGSTTTTLPPDIAAFLVTVDVFESQAEAFKAQVQRINDDWERRASTFTATRNAFDDLGATVRQWEDEVAATSGVPQPLAEGHVNLVVEAADLAPKIEDIILGLEAPDDGTLRRTAVAEFDTEVGEVLAILTSIRTRAAEATGGTTTVTDGASSTG